jgi:hypothetical protein
MDLTTFMQPLHLAWARIGATTISKHAKGRKKPKNHRAKRKTRLKAQRQARKRSRPRYKRRARKQGPIRAWSRYNSNK